MTTTASKQALLMREIAGPEKMPWVRMAYTLVAPAEINLKRERNSIMHYTSRRTRYILEQKSFVMRHFFQIHLPQQVNKGTYLSAAWQIVPHVSAMSSTRMATRSVTSPTSTMRSTSFAFFLSLWIRAKSTFNLSAIEVTLQR